MSGDDLPSEGSIPPRVYARGRTISGLGAERSDEISGKWGRPRFFPAVVQTLPAFEGLLGETATLTNSYVTEPCN